MMMMIKATQKNQTILAVNMVCAYIRKGVRSRELMCVVVLPYLRCT